MAGIVIRFGQHFKRLHPFFARVGRFVLSVSRLAVGLDFAGNRPAFRTQRAGRPGGWGGTMRDMKTWNRIRIKRTVAGFLLVLFSLGLFGAGGCQNFDLNYENSETGETNWDDPWKAKTEEKRDEPDPTTQRIMELKNKNGSLLAENRKLRDEHGMAVSKAAELQRRDTAMSKKVATLEREVRKQGELLDVLRDLPAERDDLKKRLEAAGITIIQLRLENRSLQKKATP